MKNSDQNSDQNSIVFIKVTGTIKPFTKKIKINDYVGVEIKDNIKDEIDCVDLAGSKYFLYFAEGSLAHFNLDFEVVERYKLSMDKSEYVENSFYPNIRNDKLGKVRILNGK